MRLTVRGGHLDRRLHFDAVSPQVLELSAGGHDRAALSRAKIDDGAVQEADLVVEVNACLADGRHAETERLWAVVFRESPSREGRRTVHGDPFQFVLASRQLHRSPYVPAVYPRPGAPNRIDSMPGHFTAYGRLGQRWSAQTHLPSVACT